MAARSSISRIAAFAAFAGALVGTGAVAAPVVERVVIVMRHGVRPPTKDPAMPAGTADRPWPKWSVAPGELTEHGTAAIRLLGADDRVKLGLAPIAGCPADGTVAIHSDSDQRTIATGNAWAAGFAPDCAIENRHQPQGAPDPLFATAGVDSPLDPARADAAVAHALGAGGIRAAEAGERPLLARLEAILCSGAASACGVAGTPSSLVPANARQRPKLAGALDRASTAAQILLLEYAEGKPMAEVGWGRASAADVTALSRFHALEFALLARPLYLAARNIRPIADLVINGIKPGEGPRLTLIVGHDTNVAALGGLLDLHWQPPGFAADDPPPGGALIFQLMHGDDGKRYVEASFRAQGLDQIRALKPGADYRKVLALPGCAAPCRPETFAKLITGKLASAD